MSTPEQKTITRVLPCKLSNEELLERAHKVGAAMDAIREAEDELRFETKRRKDIIAGVRSDMALWGKHLQDGAEHRDVELKIVYRVESNEVDYVRLDTGEVVESRAMSSSERQTQLALSGASEPDAINGTADVFGGAQ